MASIDHLPSGKWRVRWREGGGRGGEAQSATFVTQRDAAIFRGLVDAAGQRWPEEYRAQTGGVVTVADLAERWLANLTGIRVRTRADYARLLERHLLPGFGARAVTAVTEEDIGRWVSSLEQTYSPKGVANIHSVAYAMFAFAARAGLRAGNPCGGRRLPRVEPREMVILTPQEVNLLASCGDELLRDVVTLLAYTGLRWGEIAGADVQHVDVLGPTPMLHVRQTWQKVGGGPAEFALGPPKSARSRRSVPLPARVVDLLLPRVAGRGRDEPLIVGHRGARLDHRHFHARRWTPALTRAAELGIEQRPRMHDLRHTCASWLLAAGLPITDVSRLLGHQSITTTVDRYGHLTSDHAARVVAALDGLGQPAAPLVSVASG